MFKRLSLTRGLAAFLLVCAAGAAQAQAYINSTISGQLAPGVYGQINIGNAAPPPLVYAQPMWGAQGPRVQQAQPMYLWVPPGHSRDWRRHCSRYQACGRPVYFLRDAPPHWRDKGHKHHHGRDGRHERRDDRHWQRDEHRHDRHERRGHGRGRHDD